MFKPQACDPEALGLDYEKLDRELDKTKSACFFGDNAAFLGSLLCSLNFSWSTDIDTAATDGVSLWWNPHFFLRLSPETRKTVLLHELWHPGRVHFIRQGTRDPKLWNIACDHRINLDLEAETRSFTGIEFAYKDRKYPPGMPEEDIYEDILQNPPPPPPNGTPGGKGMVGDMIPLAPEDLIKAINNVVKAVQQAHIHGQAGNLPGNIQETISTFLAPVVPWEQLLHRFMHDLLNDEYTWRKPNRRLSPSDLYMPSRFTDDGRLEHLIYFQDVSGSISNGDLIRFCSEVKYVKETYQPQKVTMVQFDTIIQKVDVLEEADPFHSIEIVGRGGTSFEPVRQYIIDHKPTAAIIFSDMCCPAMEPLPFEVPIVWVQVGGYVKSVPFGTLINIRG